MSTNDPDLRSLLQMQIELIDIQSGHLVVQSISMARVLVYHVIRKLCDRVYDSDESVT